MSPLDLIKDGIDKNDWSKVVAGYEAMTGTKLPKKESAYSLEMLCQALEELLLKAREQKTLPKETKKKGRPPKDKSQPSPFEKPIDEDENEVPLEDMSYLPKVRTPRRPPATNHTIVCEKCGQSRTISDIEYSFIQSAVGASTLCDGCKQALRKKYD